MNESLSSQLKVIILSKKYTPLNLVSSAVEMATVLSYIACLWKTNEYEQQHPFVAESV